MDPANIVGLCRPHHSAYDEHRLDILPYLTVEEQARLVLEAGGIEQARIRATGERHG